MRVFYIAVVAVITLLSCNNERDPNNDFLRNTVWLYHDFGDCQDLLEFKDSTFTFSQCEAMEKSSGKYWVERDSIYLLIPVPPKESLVVAGDSVEVNARWHSIRPTLFKLYYRNDTLKMISRIDNYKSATPRIRSEFSDSIFVKMESF